ncbi:transposase [Spirochaetia bacterium]|nr:transposase [Bacilli bacterium]GHV49127.1 transposase [Spirochaetia bacterium]
MIFDLSTARIFIRPGNTDLRKAVNGLTAIVQEGMALDPFNGNVYLFCNRERKLLKAVYWDKTGFWLSQKRLEKDKFPWPEDESGVRELTAEQLQMLLTGIDFFKAHQELFYKKVS